MMMRNRLLFFFSLLFLLWGCHRNGHVHSQGYIEGRLTYLSSSVSGTLLDIQKPRGSRVSAHDLLFTLDPNPEQHQVKQAAALRDNALANLHNLEKGERPSEINALYAKRKQVESQWQYAKQTLKRYQTLFNKNFITTNELDQAKANEKNLASQLKEIRENLITAELGAREDQIHAAKASLDAAEAALKKAEWALSQKTMLAPDAGIIFDTYYRVGEFVPSNQPIASLITPQNIHIIFFVSEKTLVLIKLNQLIKINIDGEKTNFSAKINYISDKAEYTPPIIYSDKTRDKLIYRVEALPVNGLSEKLHIGQPVTVDID